MLVRLSQVRIEQFGVLALAYVAFPGKPLYSLNCLSPSDWRSTKGT